MEAMPQRWTDDRMDDLGAKVDRVDADVRALRGEMKTEFAAVRGEMREGFAKMEKRFDKIDERFEKADERFEKSEVRSDERFERLHRLMVQFCGLAIAALIGLIATQI